MDYVIWYKDTFYGDEVTDCASVEEAKQKAAEQRRLQDIELEGEELQFPVNILQNGEVIGTATCYEDLIEEVEEA